MSSPCIVFLTDFGTTSHYVAAMKGAVLSISPKARLVDLTHEVPPQDIANGAYQLMSCFEYFPKGTIFVAVVDPGVGSNRKGICVKAFQRYFVGPDNGLLSWVLRGKDRYQARELTNRRFYLKPRPSSTFHGRDIFAPAAAHLARKASVFKQLGRSLSRVKRLEFPPVKNTRNEIKGVVLCFDSFGNAITNIHRDDAAKRFWDQAAVFSRKLRCKKINTHYAQSGSRCLALWDSRGFLELAKPQKSLKRSGSVKIGDVVKVRRSV